MKNTVKFITVLLLCGILLSLFAIGISAASEKTETVNPDDEYYYEEEVTLPIMPKTVARVLLILFSSLFGIVLPLSPLVVFTVKLIKKKKEFEVVDYVILSISCVWLMAGVLIFAILL